MLFHRQKAMPVPLKARERPQERSGNFDSLAVPMYNPDANGLKGEDDG